jgi:cell division protein FtsZ
VLLSISGGSDLGLFEINEAAQLVADAAHPDANIIFGAVIDDALGDEVRVTVIAAGFDAGVPTPVRRVETRRPVDAADPGMSSAASYVPTAAAEAQRLRAASVTAESDPQRRPAPAPAPTPRRTVVFEDDLDVPDFLK